MRKFLAALFFLIIFLSELFAQEVKTPLSKNIYIDTKIYYGFIICHHKSMLLLASTHLTAFELSINKPTYGERSWHQLYKYPQMGLCMWYTTLGHSQILGSATAVFPFINFPLLQSKKTSIDFRFGTGLGYLSRRFDRFDDFKNNAIGSHLNAAVNLLYQFKYDLNNKNAISAGIGLAHFSNGAFKMPNLGINVPTIHLGFTHKFISQDNLSYTKTALPVINKKNEFLIFCAIGAKEIYPICGKRFFTSTISGLYSRVLSHKRKIGVGLDFSYSASNIQTLADNEIYPKYNIFATRPGLCISHELVFAKMSFVMQCGAYLYAMDKSDGMYYDRFGFRYQINKHFFANLTLKTHFAKADYIEWGFGYKF
jgi:hypothetical protein